MQLREWPATSKAGRERERERGPLLVGEEVEEGGREASCLHRKREIFAALKGGMEDPAVHCLHGVGGKG